MALKGSGGQRQGQMVAEGGAGVVGWDSTTEG